MSWMVLYPSDIWPYFITLVILVGLAIYGWYRRSQPGVLIFALSSLIAALGVAASILEYSAVEVAAKIFWHKYLVFNQVPQITILTCFLLEYTWPGRWLTRRNLALLAVVPLLVVVLGLTNDLHHLMWLGFSLAGEAVVPLAGPSYWFFFAYISALSLLQIAIYSWLLLHSPQNRWPVTFMLMGLIIAFGLYLLDRFAILHSPLPIIAFEYLMFTIALFGFRIFTPVTLARQTILAQLRDGVVVQDERDQVAWLNPAAQAILQITEKQALRRPVQELLPIPAGLAGALCGDNPGQVEIRLGSGLETRDYTLTSSVLKDWRGLAVGRLLLLRDVTEQKQAQAQIIVQQRVLATLNERERMARELHDSLGQVLGYTSFQVETAAKLSHDGQGAAAAVQLDRLGSVIRDAHADLREYILNLRSAPSLQQPFFSVVKQYLESYTSNYDIQTHLAIGPGLNDETITAEAQLHLFRILQEALSNARKHGHARQVQVRFSVADEQFCMAIHDDGCGFATGPVEAAGEHHFGLQFMQERAEKLCGSLQVHSAPGTGTRIVLQMPGKGQAGFPG